MQSEYYIQSLLKKFVLNQCSKQEVDEVVAYIQGIKESSQLPSVEEVLELLDEKPILNEVVANRIENSIIKEVQKDKITSLKKKVQFCKYAAAAIFIGLISTTYVFRNNILNTPLEVTPKIVNAIFPGTDKAKLTLEDGSVVVLEKGAAFKTKNANSNGEEIVYQAAKEKASVIKYNYLTIPRGGQFFVKLSDGTQVWLNSESQLKYPVNFIEGETRKVELVYGEAYFDVSPSTNHKGAKFKVINNAQEVEVLGTEFNIKAYKDEANIYTTLVEGKVAISTPNLKQLLIPNQQSFVDTLKDTLSVIKVDVKGEISWKDGVFSFVDKPLIDIMKVISRWYDVDIIFENKELESVEFMGTLNKNQSIEEILSIMKSFSINNYEIKDKTIILK
jgi:transmembrane sensor|tara:strand:- start:11227 stop:12396 length:1170 start_codon:yes stop_codon:yes gene_type:complete